MPMTTMFKVRFPLAILKLPHGLVATYLSGSIDERRAGSADLATPIARWVLSDSALPLLAWALPKLSRLSQARRTTPNGFLLAKWTRRGVLGLCPVTLRRAMVSSRRRVMLSEDWLRFESDFPNQ